MLRQSYDVHAELATQSTIVFVVGIGERPEALLRLAGDVDEAVRRHAPPGQRDAADLPAGRGARARRRAARRVPRRRRARRRSTTPSGGSRASRSPATRRASRRCCPASGSPSEIVRYLRETVAAGGRLHGASDPAFETVFVLREHSPQI